MTTMARGRPVSDKEIDTTSTAYSVPQRHAYIHYKVFLKLRFPLPFEGKDYEDSNYGLISYVNEVFSKTSSLILRFCLYEYQNTGVKE